jgi:hypothetical protein
MTNCLELETIAVFFGHFNEASLLCGKNGEILNINTGCMYMCSNIQGDKFYGIIV